MKNLKAFIFPDPQQEATIGRILKHQEKSGEECFGLMTSYLTPNDYLMRPLQEQVAIDQKNRTSFANLKLQLTFHRLNYLVVDGRWPLKQQDGTEIVVREPSVFIPGLTKDLALVLMNNYEQDAVVYCGPETEDRLMLIWKSGRVEDKGEYGS